MVGELPDVPPAETQVFLREAHDSVGPGRVMVHAMVPPDASPDALRAALTQLVERQVEQDPAMVALRVVAYGVHAPQGAASGAQATLRPVAWAEWLPLAGWWSEDATREEPHKVYTYIGIAPEW